MASTPDFLCFLFFALFSLANLFQVTNATFVLPVVKDNQKSQYYAVFQTGTFPGTTWVHLDIDLGNYWSWMACDIYGLNISHTFGPITCGTRKCIAYGQPNMDCRGCKDCGNYTCGIFAYSKLDDRLYAGALYQDSMSLYGLRPGVSEQLNLEATTLRDFSFACTDKGPLKGLSPYTKGLITLARRPNALHAQVSSTLKVPRKFALCLPASSRSMLGYNGLLYFGGGPYHLPFTNPIDLSRSLVTTPFVINPVSQNDVLMPGPSIEYFIKVLSIKVDGTPLHFNNNLLSISKVGVGGTKLSTMDAYTSLHSEIYKALVDVFVNKAATMKITRVASIAPFGACFDSKTIRNTKTGPGVPIIDLILDGKSPILHDKNARWRIYGANSMVKISNNVLCLGFVNGGLKPTTSIVIGGKQMEDNLVEFDLENSTLGISSSLLGKGTTCSQFHGI